MELDDETNNTPVVWTDRQTGRQTDRQTAMHMSPQCSVYRWAQIYLEKSIFESSGPESAGVRDTVTKSLCCLTNVNNPGKQMKVTIRETAKVINLEQLYPEPSITMDQLTIDARKLH